MRTKIHNIGIEQVGQLGNTFRGIMFWASVNHWHEQRIADELMAAAASDDVPVDAICYNPKDDRWERAINILQPNLRIAAINYINGRGPRPITAAMPRTKMPKEYATRPMDPKLVQDCEKAVTRAMRGTYPTKTRRATIPAKVVEQPQPSPIAVLCCCMCGTPANKLPFAHGIEDKLYCQRCLGKAFPNGLPTYSQMKQMRAKNNTNNNQEE